MDHVVVQLPRGPDHEPNLLVISMATQLTDVMFGLHNDEESAHEYVSTRRLVKELSKYWRTAVVQLTDVCKLAAIASNCTLNVLSV